MVRVRTFGGLVAALALGACGAQEAIDDAKAQISTFHADLDAGDYEMIWKETSPEFREATSSADFERLLGVVHGKLGKVERSDQTGWQVKATTGGKLTVVAMETEFEHGRGVETFTYVRKGERLELMGYNINSTDMMIN